MLHSSFNTNIILHVKPEVKSILWDIYNQYGREKFRNLAYEKALNDGSLTIVNIHQMDAHAYRILNNGFSLQCVVIQEIKTILDVQHTHDFNSPINMDKLQLLIKHLRQNESKIVTAFGLRCRRASDPADFSTRNAVDLTNQILRRWGFSTLSRKGRKRKRVHGVQVEASVFSLRNSAVVSVYESIKPMRKCKSFCT